ncbi:MAG: hypothetical protein ABWZ08_10705 [Pseudoxanthomonas sp.]
MKSGQSPPRAFFAALPPPSWIEIAERRFIETGLVQKLGETIVPVENLHQSFSERIFRPTAEQLDDMAHVGASIFAHAATLYFNRIEGPDLNAGKTYCTLRARGMPPAFLTLRGEIHNRLIKAGFKEIATGVTPHMTLSYGARSSFENIQLNPPIPWTIIELCLVIGSGNPYRYEVIGRWPLLPEMDPPIAQPQLF